MKKTITKWVGLLGMAAVLIGVPAMASSADLPEAVKKLIKPAQAEGEATVFGTTMNPRQVAMMNKGFNSFYGTSIKLNQVGGPPYAQAGGGHPGPEKQRAHGTRPLLDIQPPRPDRGRRHRQVRLGRGIRCAEKA